MTKITTLFIAPLLAGLVSAPVSASADTASADTAEGYAVSVNYDGATHELLLTFTEEQRSSNACDLVVTGFEYMADVGLMDLELQADFCPMDIVGYRKAKMKWGLPRPLRAGGEFRLRVNKKVLGTVVLNGSAGAASLQLKK